MQEDTSLVFGVRVFWSEVCWIDNKVTTEVFNFFRLVSVWFRFANYSKRFFAVRPLNEKFSTVDTCQFGTLYSKFNFFIAVFMPEVFVLVLG